jgi:hypothetical protein
MPLELPTRPDTYTAARLTLTVDKIDGWGFLYITPPAALEAGGPHCIPPRLLPAFLQLIGADEIGLAGTQYTIPVAVSVYPAGIFQKSFKISAEMEGLSWYATERAALAALQPA